MHRVAASKTVAQLARVSPATWFAFIALAVAILVVEIGLREPARGAGVVMPAPRWAAGALERVRSVPFAHMRDAEAGAVASGVIFGRTEHVSVADQEAFLGSGLWHLLAASGQNIALVAACCILVARAFGAGRTTGAVLALVAIPAYVLIVGGGASIVRAGMMGELALLAWLAGRLADVRHMLITVAAIICWIWPGAQRGLGMQLSFACVVALALWAEPVSQSIRSSGVPTWLAGAVAATVLCSAVTAPILMMRTDAAPLLGVIANVVAVPLAGMLLVVGLAGTACALAADALGQSFLADVAMWPSEQLARMLIRVAHRAAALPAAQSGSAVLAVGVPALGFALWKLRSRRPGGRILLAAGAVTVLVLGSAATLERSTGIAPLAQGDLRIAVLDIGQGDATLLVHGSHAVLIDAGPPDGRVVERVRKLGVRQIDGIVLTHDSLDHRGGFERALEALQPKWIAMPRGAPGPWQRIRALAPDIIALCAGDGFEVGAARIDVMHPSCDGSIAPRTGDIHNDGAMVLLVSHGGVRALLPADAEAPVLLGLGLPPLDLLRVAHHGSSDDELPALLSRTTPEVAAISVGDGNTYGHPTQQASDALSDAGVETWRTDRDGTVVFDSDGRVLRVMT